MLNKAKKKAIVEWVNCLSDSDPIEALNHLADGVTFFKLSQLISQTDEDFESIREKYSFVEKCLNEFYKTSISAYVNLEACEDGDQQQLAILAILLLAAVVQVSLASGQSLLQGLTQLEPRVQEDIQECISSVLLGDDRNTTSLPPNFAAVLCQQTKYKEHAMGPTPKKKGASPSYHTPKRDTRNRKRANDGQLVASPIPSPLKTLLDSPQVRQMVALRETEREVMKMRALLHVEQDKNSDLENEVKSSKRVIADKENEITALKQKVNELSEYRDISDEFAVYKMDEEKRGEALNQRWCKKYEALEKKYEMLEEENKQKESDNCCLLNKQTFASTTISHNEKEMKELQLKIEELNALLKAKEDEIRKVCIERDELKEIVAVNKIKSEEKQKDQEQIECEPGDAQVGESLGMISDGRNYSENLRSRIGRQEQVISNQKRMIEEKNNKIKDLEISRASLQQNFECAHVQSTRLVEENCALKKKFSENSEDLKKIKLEFETSQKSCRDLEKEIVLLKEENVMLKSEIDSYKEKVNHLEKELVMLKFDAVQKNNSFEIIENQLHQCIEDNEGLRKKNEYLEAAKDSMKSELEEHKTEKSALECNSQVLEKQIEEKKESMISLETELMEIRTGLNLDPDLNRRKKISVGALIEENARYIHLFKEASEKLIARDLDYRNVCNEKDALSVSKAQLEREKQELTDAHSAELQLIRQESDGVRSQMTSLLDVIKNEMNSFFTEADVSHQEHLSFDSNMQSYSEEEIALLISDIQKFLSNYEKLKADHEKLKDLNVENTGGIEGNRVVQNLKLEAQKQKITRLEIELKKSQDDKDCLQSQLDTEVNNYVEVVVQKERVAEELEQEKKKLKSKEALLRDLESKLKDEIHKCNKIGEEWDSKYEQLTEDLENSKSELQHAKKKNNDLNQKNKDLKAEVGKYTLTNKRLSSEVSRKSTKLKELESENDKLRVDKDKLQSKIEKMSSVIEKPKSRSRRSSSSRDMSSLEAECEKLREEHSFYRERSEKSKKLEQEVKQKNKEIQRLKSKIEAMSSHREEKERREASLQRELKEAEQEASAMKEKYEEELNHIRKESFTLKESLESQLKTKISVLCEIQAKIAQKEQKIQCMLNENKELHSQNLELQNELKTAAIEMQNSHNTINQSVSEKKAAAIEMQNLCNTNNQLLNEKNKKECELQSYATRNEELLMRLQEIQFVKEDEISGLKKIIEELRSEKQSMETQTNERFDEIQFLRSTVEQLENEHGQLKKSHEDLQLKYAELQLQIDNTRNDNDESLKIMQETEESYEEKNNLPVEANAEYETSAAEKIHNLESADIEIATLTEQVEDLERKLNTAYESKELAEKEYYLCTQEKDRIIERLECEISELQFALKQVDFKMSDSKTISVAKKTVAIQSHNSLIDQNDDENSKIRAKELSDLQEKLEEMEVKLKDTEKELKESWEKEKILERKYQDLYYSIRQKLLECEANCDRKLRALQDKLRETEQKLTDTDVSKMDTEMELTSVRKMNADLIKETEVLKRKITNLEAQDSSDALRQELEMMNVSLQDMTEKVKQSEASIKKMRLENRSLTAQLELANRQIRGLNEDTDKRNSLFATASRRSPRIPSRIGRTTSEKFAKNGFKKSLLSPNKYASPKKRASSLREESKKHRIPAPSPSPLERFFRRSRDKLKDCRSSSSFTRESKGSPFLVQRNTSRYSSLKETYLVHEKESTLPSTSSGLNTSISSKSKYTGLDWFKSYDEDDYLGFNSLPTLRGYRSLSNDNDEAGSRVSELQRRNTLVPPHMRTSYSVEMQMQPETKYTHDDIREGPVGKEEDDDTVGSEHFDDFEFDKELPMPDSMNPYVLWKQKLCAGLSPEESERKLNEQPSYLKGLPMRAMNPFTPSGKRRNPFQLPYVSSWEKKKKREEKGRGEGIKKK